MKLLELPPCYCGAGEGEPCVSKSGRPHTDYIHNGRKFTAPKEPEPRRSIRELHLNQYPLAREYTWDISGYMLF